MASSSTVDPRQEIMGQAGQSALRSAFLPLLCAHACLVLANGPKKGAESLEIILPVLVPALAALVCLVWAGRGAKVRSHMQVPILLGRVLLLSGVLFAVFGNLVYGPDPWGLFPWRLLAVPLLALYLLPPEPEAGSALRFLYGRPRRIVFWSLLLLAVGLRIAALICSPEPLIDVWYFTNEGARGLLEGINPYDRAFTVVDPRSETLYAYLPGQFLFDLPAAVLLGDMRWGQVLVELITAGLLYRIALAPGSGRAWSARRQAAEALALLWLYWPQSLFSQEQAWVEFKQVFAAALLAWFFVSGTTRGGWASVGLLFGLKQTTWPAGAFLLRLPKALPEGVSIALGVLCALLIPFGIWNPQALYQDIVGYHVGLPLPHSPSLTWTLVLWTGWVLPLWGLALLGGCMWIWLESTVADELRLHTRLLAWLRGKERSWPRSSLLEGLESFFVAAAALSLVPVVMRQAYVNYYAYVEGLVLIGLAVATRRLGDLEGEVSDVPGVPIV